MSDFPEHIDDRAQLYADHPSAIKAHERRQAYLTERDVYLRLQERGVTKIRGHHVPELMDYDDYLWVIEISIVRRPYVLDFAKATIDVAPGFPPQVMREWLQGKSRDFGDHWPAVLAIMNELVNRYGIHLTDLNPGNIAFED